MMVYESSPQLPDLEGVNLCLECSCDTASIHNQDVKGALQIADQIQEVCCGREQNEKEEKNISFLRA